MSALGGKADIAFQSGLERLWVTCTSFANKHETNFEEACRRSRWQIPRSREPVAIGSLILATILQFERFRIDDSDGALTGRTP